MPYLIIDWTAKTENITHELIKAVALIDGLHQFLKHHVTMREIETGNEYTWTHPTITPGDPPCESKKRTAMCPTICPPQNIDRQNAPSMPATGTIAPSIDSSGETAKQRVPPKTARAKRGTNSENAPTASEKKPNGE